MTRILLALMLGVAVGCTGLQPAGPLAKMTADSQTKKPVATKDWESDEPTGPITVPAPLPTPPLNTVGPEDVTAENPQQALERTQQEIEADSRNLPPAPITAEVSRYKNGVKQN